MGLTQKLGTIPLAIQTDTSNNVGIGGTPSGTYGKLSVFGGVSIKDDNNAKLEIGRYSSGASNSYIKLGANSNSLRISNATDSADLITFTNSGNVGIGTTTPALTTSNRTTLDIGNATESILVLSTGGSWRSYFYNDGTNLSIANSGGFINFDVLGERMRITNTGNVGIGTSSPITLFQVRNNMWQHYISKYFTSQTNFLSVNIPNNGACFITIVSSAYRPGVDTYSQAVKFAIIVRAGNTTITSDGNYGNTTEVGYSISGATTTFYFRYAGGSTNYQNAFITLQAVSQNGYEESVNITLL